MQVHQDVDIHHYSIKSYSKGEITVQIPLLAELTEPASADEEPRKGLEPETLTQSMIISADALVRDWPPQSLAQLTEENIEALLAFKPEVVIIGTGERLQWPPRKLMAPLIDAGIGYEIMDTAAACRTYNVLSYEGRTVVAGLMMI